MLNFLLVPSPVRPEVVCVCVCVCACVCVCVHVCAQLLSRVQLFAPLWTVTHRAPLSMEFSRQEYRSIAIPYSRKSS